MSGRFTYFRAADGKPAVDSKATFVGSLAGMTSVLGLPSFIEVLEKAEKLARAEESGIDANAFSNVRGDWYEWLLGLGAAEYCKSNGSAHYFLPLPNIRQFDCAKLYNQEIYDYIADLRVKVEASSGVSLITSNPDFVIVGRSFPINLPDPAQGVSDAAVTMLNDACRHLTGHCDLDQIIGYASSKSSLRPDRRLQIAHEGSLMKALYKHVQTRKWLLDAKGIKYYAITPKAGPADYNALKTVATHSITDVGSLPQAAVDMLFCANSGAELRAIFDEILA